MDQSGLHNALKWYSTGFSNALIFASGLFNVFKRTGNGFTDPVVQWYDRYSAWRFAFNRERQRRMPNSSNYNPTEEERQTKHNALSIRRW